MFPKSPCTVSLEPGQVSQCRRRVGPHPWGRPPHPAWACALHDSDTLHRTENLSTKMKRLRDVQTVIKSLRRITITIGCPSCLLCQVLTCSTRGGTLRGWRLRAVTC